MSRYEERPPDPSKPIAVLFGYDPQALHGHSETHMYATVDARGDDPITRALRHKAERETEHPDWIWAIGANEAARAAYDGPSEPRPGGPIG